MAKNRNMMSGIDGGEIVRTLDLNQFGYLVHDIVFANITGSDSRCSTEKATLKEFLLPRLGVEYLILFK
jgi:hypothetical protein